MRISNLGIMELSGMEFHANHDCLECEQKDGNLFVVDFKAAYWLKRPATTDNIHDAADYGVIFKLVRQEMEQHSDLLEHLARRIVEAVQRKFPDSFVQIKVTVSKRNPPVGGHCEWSRISVYSQIPPRLRGNKQNQFLI